MVKRHLSLSDLLEHDMSSYEYFNSLPPQLQSELNQHDIASFEELQRKAFDLTQGKDVTSL